MSDEPIDLDATSRNIDAALETAAASRLFASQARQMGFSEAAKYYEANAKAAERWAVKMAKWGG